VRQDGDLALFNHPFCQNYQYSLRRDSFLFFGFSGFNRGHLGLLGQVLDEEESLTVFGCQLLVRIDIL
jgi:hypothetical protein